MAKATKKDLKLFKDTAYHWQMKLGLTQYYLEFNFSDDLGSNNDGFPIFANLEVSEMGKTATLTLLIEFDKGYKDAFNTEQFARHEMLHLLSQRLYWLGIQRYLNPSDLLEE